MKKIRTIIALGLSISGAVSSADLRCNEPTLANPLGGLVLADAYKVLTWADKCKPKQLQATRYKMNRS